MDAGSTISMKMAVQQTGTDQPFYSYPSFVRCAERIPDLGTDYAVLEGGNGCSFYLNLSAGTDLYTDVVPLELVFKITDMNTLESGEVEHQVILDAVSLSGHLDRENRIRGVWENFLPSPFDDHWGRIRY